MKHEINWEKRAEQRKWCAAERWNEAMGDNFTDKEEPSEIPLHIKRREQAIKTRDALLAKNPNHFKELSAKSREKNKR